MATVSLPAMWSLLVRLECAPQFVGERSESFRRRRIRAFAVLAHFRSLFRVEDRLRTEPDAAARRIDFEHRDLDVTADRKHASDVCVLRDAGLAHRDEAGASRRQKHEHAELLVTL